jgi:hypothetical protein
LAAGAGAECHGGAVPLHLSRDSLSLPGIPLEELDLAWSQFEIA